MSDRLATAGEGAIDAGIHRFPIRVYYEDTDAVGLVYHANHLRFAERARTEMLRCLGFAHGELQASHGVTFAVRRCEVDYLAPARLDDHLVVRTRMLRLGGASTDLEQRIWRGERLLVEVVIRLVLLDGRQRVARLPAPLRQAFGRLRQATAEADPVARRPRWRSDGERPTP